jgi:hypothetical protein
MAVGIKKILSILDEARNGARVGFIHVLAEEGAGLVGLGVPRLALHQPIELKLKRSLVQVANVPAVGFSHRRIGHRRQSALVHLSNPIVLCFCAIIFDFLFGAVKKADDLRGAKGKGESRGAHRACGDNNG